MDSGSNARDLVALTNEALSISITQKKSIIGTLTQLDRITYGFVENDSDLVHSLIEIEGALVGFSRTEKDYGQFDNDRRNFYKKYKSEFEEGKGEGVLDPQQIEEDLFNHIVWTLRIWCIPIIISTKLKLGVAEGVADGFTVTCVLSFRVADMNFTIT
ncbi:hypothetical protein Golob_006933, partial [Gossypium lobatum]|nr:hypothetical protein [Gossypium lobatum]